MLITYEKYRVVWGGFRFITQSVPSCLLREFDPMQCGGGSEVQAAVLAFIAVPCRSDYERPPREFAAERAFNVVSHVLYEL